MGLKEVTEDILMNFPARRLYLFAPLVFAGVAVIALLFGMGGAAQGAEPPALPTRCFASSDGGSSFFSSSDAAAVQAAVDDLGAAGGEVRIAGTCEGVHARGGVTGTVYISAPVTLRGGYTTTNWSVSDPATNPTVLDALGQGRVVYASAALTVENLTAQNGDGTNAGALSQGGGILVNLTLTMSGAQVISNTTTGIGGGISTSGAVKIVNSRIEVEKKSGGGDSTLYLPAVQSESGKASGQSASLNRALFLPAIGR